MVVSRGVMDLLSGCVLCGVWGVGCGVWNEEPEEHEERKNGVIQLEVNPAPSSRTLYPSLPSLAP